MLKLRVMAAMAAGAMGLLAPGLASAHFTLVSPTNWAVQGAQGLPEKSAPCGQADPPPAAVPTNVVTTYRPGQTIMVMITEDVPHPGWYKAVLSQNGMSSLPADPMVTDTSASGGSACGTSSTATNTIVGLTPNKTPQLPVLVDGALFHTGTLSGQQMFPVTLPSNVTCTNCVLQVVEFMSNHGLNVPGGCFYHHCANIAIQGAPITDGGTSTDAATGTGGKTGAGGTTGTAGATGTGAGGSTAGTGGTTGGAGGTTAGAGGSTTAGAGGSTTGTAGTSGGTGGTTGTDGSTTGDGGSNGCSCAVASGTGGSVGGLVGLLLAVVLIRRRRHSKR